MSIDTADTDDDDLSAAEFVLGLLDAGAQRKAEARLKSDAEFAADVAQWEAHFAPWLQGIVPVAAPSDLWPRIRSMLWAHELSRRTDAPPPARRWQSLAVWRGLAIAGLAATAASLVVLTVVLRQPAPTPTAPIVVTKPPRPGVAPMAVVMRRDDGSIAYTATLDSDGTLVVTPVQAQPDPRAPELWLIPAGDKPHSLGMLQRDRAMAVRVPAGLRSVARDSLFAVSMEPAGSGPHAAPTGPVVAKGALITL